MLRSVRVLSLAAVLAAAVMAPAVAGIVVYEEGARKIEIGARVQIQYRYLEEDDGRTFDDLFFRRLRPYIAGTVMENWMAKIEFDFGEAEEQNEIAVKDAYMQWSGLKNHKITFGNSKTPFSREFLTSSTKLNLIERSFAGSHNFGSPDRQLGLRIDGHTDSKKLTWFATIGSESQDPAVERIDFDTPVNRESDWNQGWVYAGRVDFHPLGHMKFDRTDFGSKEFKFNVSLAAYAWENDDDNNTYIDPNIDPNIRASKVDLDEALGIEISAGLRGHGVSADLEYQMVSADTIDPNFSGGLYADGTTDLDKISIQAGYFLPFAPVEFVVGWDSLDADGYETKWTRTSLGVNWYWNRQNAKIQAVYRTNCDLAGTEGADLNEVIIQTQFLF